MSGSARLLIRYDNACRALAEARSVDEVKDVRDKAIAMAAYARQARNRDLEADAIEIRLRATRRLDQLRQAQKATVGLNEGGRPRKTGVSDTPVVPTLASQGIDKNLAKQGRVLGALSDEQFESVVASAREAATRVVKTVVRGLDIVQVRKESYEPPGGTVADLVVAGQRFNVIYADLAILRDVNPHVFHTSRADGAYRPGDVGLPECGGRAGHGCQSLLMAGQVIVSSERSSGARHWCPVLLHR